MVFGNHDHRQSERFAARFGVHVLEAYGSTEIGFPLIQRIPVPDVAHRWCGSPRPGYRLRVVAEDGTEVPDGGGGDAVTDRGSR